MTKTTREDFLSILGDADNEKYPIYMTGNVYAYEFFSCQSSFYCKFFSSYSWFLGPLLHTLCTAVIDLDEQTLSIIKGNPKKEDASFVFSLSSMNLINDNLV